MTKMANSLAGYIALLRQLGLLCKVGLAIALPQDNSPPLPQDKFPILQGRHHVLRIHGQESLAHLLPLQQIYFLHKEKTLPFTRQTTLDKFIY